MRKLGDIYLGMLSKNGYFESYTERQVRSLGGVAGDICHYHHQTVFDALSPRKDWQDIYAKESTIRFTRKGRITHVIESGGNIHIFGEAALKPFSKKNKARIEALAKVLILKGVPPDTKFEIPVFHLPKKKAPYQGKAIGTLREFAEGVVKDGII